MTQRKIIATPIYPPIPTRAFDWAAHFDGCEESGPTGTGPTEEAAIADLLGQAEEDAEPINPYGEGEPQQLEG